MAYPLATLIGRVVNGRTTTLPGYQYGADYRFVDPSHPNASDENDGSAEYPWASLAGACWGSPVRASPDALSAAQAGNTVVVYPGIYNTSEVTNSRFTPIYNPVNSGAAGNPIRFQALQRGTVEVRTTNGNGAQPTIGALNRDYIIWDGFLVQQEFCRTAPDTGPVVLWDSDYCEVLNSEIVGYTWYSNDNDCGVRLENTLGCRVANNLIRDYVSSGHAQPIETYDTKGLIIEHNTIRNNRAGGFIKGGGIRYGGNSEITVRYNMFEQTVPAVRSAGLGFGVVSPIYGNGSFGVRSYGNITRGCNWGYWLISYNGTSPQHITIANDTILNAIDPEGGAISMRGADGPGAYDDLVFRNNIYSVSVSGYVFWDGTSIAKMDSDYCLFDVSSGAAVSGLYQAPSGTYSLPQLRALLGGDANSITGSPLFVSYSTGDYRLQEGSPARNACPDYLNVAGGGTINMGAYMTGNEQIGIDW